MRYAFIEGHRAMWRLPIMCRVLAVSKSGYFVWRDGREGPRRSQDRALSVRIKAIHQQSRQTYGSPRIHHELKANGVAVGKKRVERLMKAAGVAVLPLRRFVTTTDSDHDQPCTESPGAGFHRDRAQPALGHRHHRHRHR